LYFFRIMYTILILFLSLIFSRFSIRKLSFFFTVEKKFNYTFHYFDVIFVFLTLFCPLYILITRLTRVIFQ
ncbi:hypothetical protein L9F63_010413, partial [Diploptera punctata]